MKPVTKTHTARKNLSCMSKADNIGQRNKNIGFSLSSVINSKVILSMSFNL